MNQILEKIGKIADSEKVEVYAVGGFARDFLLNRKTKDIDFVVVGKGIKFAKKVAKILGKKKVVTYERFETAMFVYKNLNLEFVSARSEIYDENSRKPKVERANLKSDQLRRDFTINALAFGLNKENFGKLYDPFEGEIDLNNKIIRTPLDPEITFSEDPLRILRAIRFASQLNFKIEAKTFEAATKMRERLKIISQERITDEFTKILNSPKPSIGLKLLEETGILKMILPEIFVWNENELLFEFVDEVSTKSQKTELRFASLLYKTNWENPTHLESNSRKVAYSTKLSKICKRFKLPINFGQETESLTSLLPLTLKVFELDFEGKFNLEKQRRYLKIVGDFFDEVWFLGRILQKIMKLDFQTQTAFKRLKNLDQKENLTDFNLALDGLEIIKISQIGQGPEIGKIKNSLEEAVLKGIVKNENKPLEQYLLTLLKS
ncbi:MAG: CCA tRNA nucleotidyltransferase [Calditrichaeota bacterium]|nr:MAG: CCA tRNA nucleotidyltransferase [Calditrichota bacterium]